MKKIVVSLFILVFLSGCASNVKIDNDKLSKVKKVAVVIFALKKSIEYRDDPKTDDSDFMAVFANTTAAGDGEEAASLGFPRFIDEMNKQGLPFRVMKSKEMLTNSKFMKLYKKPEDGGLLGALGSFFVGAPPAKSPRGFMNFGLPVDYDETGGSALTGDDGEAEYIKAAIAALKVDAALVITDRGTSFLCNTLCALGNGQSSMGGAFHSALVDRSGNVIVKLNTSFVGDANAVMVNYLVDPTSRDTLYKAHGKKMAQQYARVFKGAK